ncbi:MAG: hypothetical protein JWM21_4659 [Acidobacteria bacterium]|nr:hypothetical protein [Acidobacteriota bacterium]
MKKKQKQEKTRVDEHSLDDVPVFDSIHAQLSHLTEVSAENFYVAFTFSLLFAEIFTRETPNYEITPGKLGATI